VPERSRFDREQGCQLRMATVSYGQGDSEAGVGREYLRKGSGGSQGRTFTYCALTGTVSGMVAVRIGDGPARAPALAGRVAQTGGGTQSCHTNGLEDVNEDIFLLSACRR